LLGSKKVSIIIPVYNAEDFLHQSITSLLQQTYTNKEIIIVDDSSKDNSYTIAKKFESENIKVLRQPNAGAAVARNTGIAHSTGDYIQFMDVDDFLSNDKIEKQLTTLASVRSKVAVCNYISFFDGQDLNSLKPGDQSSFIYNSDDPAEFLLNLWGANGESNFIQTNSWLIPRTIIEKSGNWRSYRCPDDDGEFFTRVLLSSEGVIYVPGVYNYYRRTTRENKLSGNTNKKYLQNTLLTIDLKFLYIQRLRSDEKIRAAFARQYLDYAVFNYGLQNVLSAIAYRKYKDLNYGVKLPKFGGKIVNLFTKLFGWKVARRFQFFFYQIGYKPVNRGLKI
jgi:glycosyltransferase involved in cell wall biosynthesis